MFTLTCRPRKTCLPRKVHFFSFRNQNSKPSRHPHTDLNFPPDFQMSHLAPKISAHCRRSLFNFADLPSFMLCVHRAQQGKANESARCYGRWGNNDTFLTQEGKGSDVHLTAVMRGGSCKTWLEVAYDLIPYIDFQH